MLSRVLINSLIFIKLDKKQFIIISNKSAENGTEVITRQDMKIQNETNGKEYMSDTIRSLHWKHTNHLKAQNEKHEELEQNEINSNKLKSKYLINTNGCSIVWWPVFDFETKPIFVNTSNKSLNCETDNQIKLIRVNGTYIRINMSQNSKAIKCFASVQPLRAKNVSGDSVK